MFRKQSWGVDYSVYSPDVKRVVKQLQKLKNYTPNNLRNAVNRAATKVKKELVKGAKAGYTLKDLAAGDIRVQRATPGYPTATFRIEGPTRTLKSYEHTDNTPGRHGTGVRVKVLKHASLKELRRAKPGGAAFMGPGGRIAGLPVQRDRAEWGSLPDKPVLHGPSKPKIYEMIHTGKGGHGQQAVEPKAREILIAEVEKEIAKLIAKSSK